MTIVTTKYTNDEYDTTALDKEFGVYGKYYPTQLPYVHDDSYVAHAIDDEGNEYRITWEITNPDCEDESDSCDWQDYRVKKI